MPLIKVPTITLFSAVTSFVFIDPAYVNNVRPESFESFGHDGKTIETVCFNSGRGVFNTTWSLEVFLTAMGRNYSTSIYDASKPLVARA